MDSAKNSKSSINTIVILILAVLFIMLAMLVITTGVSVYGSTVERAEYSYQIRTSLSYIVNQSRMYDSEGSISVSEIEGSPALKLSTEQGGIVWSTYIYYYDGYIREIPLAREGAQLHSTTGLGLIEASGLQLIPRDNGMVEIIVTGSTGESGRTFITPKSFSQND